jgi:DNA-binding MarR family transcriptional regulator
LLSPRLRDRGLVDKNSDPDDARAQRVFLTADGRAAAAAVRQQERDFARSVLQHLPGGTASATVDALEELIAAIRTATERCCPGAYDHLMQEAGKAGKS